MGNCHKNRICEFLNNHCCPQFFLDCFQSIFPQRWNNCNHKHKHEYDQDDDDEQDDHHNCNSAIEDEDDNDQEEEEHSGGTFSKLPTEYEEEEEYGEGEEEEEYYNYPNQTTETKLQKTCIINNNNNNNKKNKTSCSTCSSVNSLSSLSNSLPGRHFLLTTLTKKSTQPTTTTACTTTTKINVKQNPESSKLLPHQLKKPENNNSNNNNNNNRQPEKNKNTKKNNQQDRNKNNKDKICEEQQQQEQHFTSQSNIDELPSATDSSVFIQEDPDSNSSILNNNTKRLQRHHYQKHHHHQLSRQQSSISQPGTIGSYFFNSNPNPNLQQQLKLSGSLCTDCATALAGASGSGRTATTTNQISQFSPTSSLLSISNNKTNSNTITNNNKLKFDLQQRLEMMIQRQRSASHCPHTSLHATHSSSGAGPSSPDKPGIVPAMNKCCCCQKAIGQAGDRRASPSTSSSILVDPLIKIMGVSSTSSTGGMGRQKRASSLRVLNKRFNFFDTKDDGISISGSRRGSKKSKRQPTKLSDLNDECFLAIFEYLTLQEKLYYERVCHRWQRLIRRSLQAPASLKIGEHSVKCNCQCAHFASWDLPPTKRYIRDKSGYIVYPKSVIKYLLTLCSQLRCINFSHCYLDDQTLQIIMDHSDLIECLHLNDIRLEEDDDDLFPNGYMDKKHNSDGQLSNGTGLAEQETISAAVGAFASEQLAVFGGLMRKLSTRRSVKKSRKDKDKQDLQDAGTNDTGSSTVVKRHSDASMMSSTGKRSVTTPGSSNGRRGTDSSGSNANYNCHSLGNNPNKSLERSKTPVNQTRSTPPSSTIRNTSSSSSRQPQAQHRPAETSPLLPSSSSNRTTSVVAPATGTGSIISSSIATTSSNHQPTTSSSQAAKILSSNYLPHDDMRQSLESIMRRTIAANQQQSQPTQTTTDTATPTKTQSITQKQADATQRRREWSKHRNTVKSAHPANKENLKLSENQQKNPPLSINVINDTMNRDNSLSLCQVSFMASDQDSTNNGNLNRQSTIKHLSPNLAPNLSSLVQTDLDTGLTVSAGSSRLPVAAYQSHSNSISSGSAGAESQNSPLANSLGLQSASGAATSAAGISQPYPFDVQGLINNTNNNIVGGKMDHVQQYVEQEQIRHELRQTHLLQWKAFAKKLGSQIRCLSLGSLSSVDSIVIDILLKYSVLLEELRINNEIDILSYLSVIKPSVKRIYINCEHGIGLECVSLLAYRNYAEKVISLGRVDVPPDLIDSVISTIGSNFSNLRSLHLRLHNFDIDVATPASLLFDNLNELNLQFVSGNVDQPFKKFIQLGWSSVQSLTIQYASITEESVRAIHEHMPQLKKLVLYAIEFRCDHLARRYGHRICTNCSHTVWKCIASLPHLNHLKLHRVIIDDEICKALSRMYRLCNLELHYCSNVNDNVITVCSDLARRSPRRRFNLSIVSRGFLNFKSPINCNNLLIDVKVACK